MPVLPPRAIAAGLLLICLGALAAAYVAQYVFGILPCVLCLTERIPYWVAAAFALGALVVGQGRAAWALLALCAVAFAVNAGIAAYHVGVEQHWWAGTSACSGTMAAVDPADLLAAMRRPSVVRCDEPSWSLFGITFAGYNLILSLLLALSTLAALRAANRR